MKSIKKLIKQLKRWQLIAIIAIIVIVIALIPTLVISTISKNNEKQANVVTVSTLEKIINVSELSTFSAVYNGIAKVNNIDKPDEIDYYVSYNAKVKAGIDFSKVQINMNDTADKETNVKKVNIIIPKVHITKINVDISSLDFIFLNPNSNVSTVTEQAYKACNEDAEKESAAQEAIYNLAEQNAKSVVTALVQPILTQLEDEQNIKYELNVTVSEE